ncbi:BEM_HP_G0078930.mRNA.1.CDS.1 [Saccharomyces cerevisiae]|nr:BEM_HP_G0078930.mRNA.1.CDS.1 [Saccharomyces cerevisiae]CAI6990894.1 BEM_HP_G0078930.mRNA.1.CDS.1 [Saccharomyces cerevisiae]
MKLDKLFDKTFVEQSDDILSACREPSLRKAMFSATIPSNVEEIAQSIMMDPVRVIIGHKEAANTNIEQKINILINVDVIHAERTALQRDRIIERFKTGELWCLICTDVLARGIDFKGVNLVINYDVPGSSQAYVHRIGRTGRGGRSGKAITFYTKQDSVAIKPIINVMKQSGCEVSEWMDKMAKNDQKGERKYKKTVKRIKKESRLLQCLRWIRPKEDVNKK